MLVCVYYNNVNNYNFRKKNWRQPIYKNVSDTPRKHHAHCVLVWHC